ncbi:MAG: 50S ribosomal protein L7/L12 [Candidatus Portnoybacteria bacterium RIFCSPLOWO2_01_FULL_43_11]|uniref:Large ribosomal subunit protein bL12 n=3 Tax=Candidatus Portnoyibacteriota TaxID=1817913 RepID=A0A1G2FCG9_9BACT|nr:MAG: 50S ribosomal protein L7/L12 [Candidatus Portnoybacteria bacterium RIFCSPHIGHO2_01_FULL_40_12b]OGZ37311.1 MAG: 50S ribosomal protein L7/L12 [Candidatus Portnoybacteria bacterium RIFCSPHIGHO2_02_FULL_40_23]OGZ38470.1 MAG: 50S ribosomal protein L7/L12 [Candidatus Portnoybacteria bacterium RIFCSPLOWO2_01_FULL_43_11]OGZ38603.1 MAG: 50S ribosomal protein L7/L12 [Candidatus Portnoybacteria bacterium RIFCSPHIGHO2_12_FULL_40_11]
MSEEKKETSKKEVKIPEKFKDLVKQIEELSVLDLADLVKILEEKFGVSAAMPMAMAPAAGAAPTAEAGASEEKTAFNIELKSAGGQKINVIKVVKEITGKGLKEAKDLVDAAPKVIKEAVAKSEAEEIKKKLEEAGATVELK